MPGSTRRQASASITTRRSISRSSRGIPTISPRTLSAISRDSQPTSAASSSTLSSRTRSRRCVCKVLQGEIGSGIRIMEQEITAREKDGYSDEADWSRLFLIEVLLQGVSRTEKLPFRVLLKNLPILLKVMATASSRIRSLTTRILENPHFFRPGVPLPGLSLRKISERPTTALC